MRNDKTKVVIVDDERHGRDVIKNLFNDYLEEFEIVGEADSIDTAINLITEYSPKLVFLDIELNNHSGFDLLDSFEQINFEVIFATAYNYYAIKAIKFSALDYLLKPIDSEEFVLAIERFKRKTSLNNIAQLNILKENIKKAKPDKLALPTDNGYVFVTVNDIIRCQGESNYTHFFLKSKSDITTCHTLGEYEDLLADYNFFRVHKSHLINMSHVKGFHKGKSGFVIMNDDTEIEISTRKREEFLDKFTRL